MFWFLSFCACACAVVPDVVRVAVIVLGARMMLRRKSPRAAAWRMVSGVLALWTGVRVSGVIPIRRVPHAATSNDTP